MKTSFLHIIISDDLTPFLIHCSTQSLNSFTHVLDLNVQIRRATNNGQIQIRIFPATCTSIHCVQIAFKVSENYVQWLKRSCVDNRFNTIFNIQMAKIESSKKRDEVPSKNNGSSIDVSLTKCFSLENLLIVVHCYICYLNAQKR